MAKALLGEEIDIHSGGEDNIFPHHECEIAQTCSATGRPVFARHWFHTRHLMVEGEKMSKSKGNFYTVSDLLARGASPAAIRLALISTHYRTNANFTMQGLKDQQRRYDYWKRADQLLGHLASNTESSDFDGFTTAKTVFEEALCDDLNVSAAYAVLDVASSEFLEQFRSQSSSDLQQSWTGPQPFQAEREAFHEAVRVLLGDRLFQDHADGPTEIHPTIEHLIARRNQARARKDFAAADRIRDELREMGIEIKDSPQGTTWERIIQ